MTPLRNLIAVKPCEPDEKTSGGLIVAESFKERPAKAKVVAIGSKTKLKVGQTVFHVVGAGTELIENGENIYLMPDKDVLGYLEN